MKKIACYSLLLIIVLAGCHTVKKVPVSVNAKEKQMNLKLVQRQWMLVKLPSFTKEQITAFDKNAPYITLLEGTVKGFGGCNQLVGGKYSLDGNTMTITNVASTRKLCAGNGSKIEQELLDILRTTNGFKMEGAKLKLFTSDKREAEFVALDWD